MDLTDVLISLGVAAGAFALWLGTTAVYIWGERRIIALMQTRIGPNRLGPFGILQTVADGAKLFFKEDIRPKNIDVAVYFLAPAMSAVVALVTFAVIPYGGSFEVAGREVNLQVWDPNIGLLWILAMSSIGVYGITLGGWASGSKYPLLGGVRSTAQMVSYELPLGLSLAAVFVWVGSLRTSDVVANQVIPAFEWGPITVPSWHFLPMIPAFAIFFVTAIAELQRPPFDLAEAEGELVGGFGTEYSGAKFAMFYLAEFMNTVTLSAVMVTVFFGGPDGPLFGPAWLQAVLPTVYFMLKVIAFLFVMVWLRGSLPRFKYNRLMDVGWKVLLPLSLAWVMITAAFVLIRETVDRGTIITVAIGTFLVLLVLMGVMTVLEKRSAEGSDDDTSVSDTPTDKDRADV